MMDEDQRGCRRAIQSQNAVTRSNRQGSKPKRQMKAGVEQSRRTTSMSKHGQTKLKMGQEELDNMYNKITKD